MYYVNMYAKTLIIFRYDSVAGSSKKIFFMDTSETLSDFTEEINVFDLEVSHPFSTRDLYHLSCLISAESL